MQKKMISRAAAIALAFASGAAAASVAAPSGPANLVNNGSFELGDPSQVPGAGAWNLYDNPVGWTVTGPSGLELRNGVAGTAQDGNVFAELDSAGNVTISQTLDTVAGKTYDLSFWYSDRPGTGAATNGMTFSAGSLSGTLDGHDNTGSDNDWHLYTGQFVASQTGPTTLTFAAGGISDSYGESLDNIRVTAAVPEPATCALMASGLALLGLSRRRRRD
jgi:hypothetical protein